MRVHSMQAPPERQDLGDGVHYLENTDVQTASYIDEFTKQLITYYTYQSVKKQYPVVPERIAAYRLRSWAMLVGLNDDIESYFASLDNPAEAVFALNAWKSSGHIYRNSHILNGYIDQSPTLTHEQVDQIFIDLYELEL